jgi:hypothetical protein
MDEKHVRVRLYDNRTTLRWTKESTITLEADGSVCLKAVAESLGVTNVEVSRRTFGLFNAHSWLRSSTQETPTHSTSIRLDIWREATSSTWAGVDGYA